MPGTSIFRVMLCSSSLFGELFQSQEPIEIGASEPATDVIQAAVIEAMGVDHAQDFIGVRTELLRQADFLSQMMQDQKRAIKPDLGDVDIRDGSGKNGLTVGLLADITNEALTTFPLILRLSTSAR